ncbi:hypothetical protein SAM23877_3356 [Streptomyces ambofaciens ATCC 23877]|uniref:Uncharacterized protein n=1 Tax=Streptomyces ambofaciens (strain ATCC 23877 / 3486 / DSM 40053 / JCM 4204 / NBRC 12836 / NRRL B-2516) TaxID=278992 RepID=A0A0K2ATT9_STRA7|nr:hypothetical protein [Streptomyces ambofaciens]AKZ56403.1 hypothetical protein SAM23877_3356 [Streptomyces ambofaciens ATCC 23877]
MPDPIGRLITRVSLLLRPRGAHRGAVPHPAPRIAPRPPATATITLPTHRSPYGLPTLLDGADTVAVRPYVLLRTSQELEAAA